MLLEESSLEGLLLLGLNLGGSFHALELSMVDHNCLALLTLLGLFADVAQLILSQGDGTSGGVLLGVTYIKFITSSSLKMKGKQSVRNGDNSST